MSAQHPAGEVGLFAADPAVARAVILQRADALAVQAETARVVGSPVQAATLQAEADATRVRAMHPSRWASLRAQSRGRF